MPNKFKSIKLLLGLALCLPFLAFTYKQRNVHQPIQTMINAQTASAYTVQTTPPTLVRSPKCKLTRSSDCWVATAKKGYKFKASSVMYLPTLGSSGGGAGGPVGTVNQAFCNDMVSHEGWHRSIHRAYVGSVYGALEGWSAGYSSAGFRTSGEARAAFATDMANALTVAHSFDGPYGAQQNRHPNPGAFVQNGLWVAINPNWGANALGVVQGFHPNFVTSPGDCN